MKKTPLFIKNLESAREDLFWKSRHENKLYKKELPEHLGDKGFEHLCDYAKNNNMNINQFRTYVMKNPKRFFKGKHLQVLHLFRPDGTARKSITEICWAIKEIGNPRFMGLFGR